MKYIDIELIIILLLCDGLYLFIVDLLFTFNVISMIPFVLIGNVIGYLIEEHIN